MTSGAPTVVVTPDGGGTAGAVRGEAHPPADQLLLAPDAVPVAAGDEEGAAVGLHAGASVAAPRRISFIVFGDPAPQGSKSGFRNQHTGRIQQVESSKKVKPWREAVKYAARLEIDARPGWTPLDGPLVAIMVFSFRRPRSHYRTGRNAHLIRDGAPSAPCSVPDLSKLLRSSEDALSDAGVWVDDARLTRYLDAAKVWCGESSDALDVPGVRIEVREASR